MERSCLTTRKRLVAIAIRREGVYNRAGKPSVPFCGKGGARERAQKKKNPETRMVTGFFDGGAGGIRTHEPVRTT